MSQLLISQYLNQLSSLKKVSGSQRESVLREAFKDLLKAWGRQHVVTKMKFKVRTQRDFAAINKEL